MYAYPSESMNHLNILFMTSDKYPPFRPAARAIFAEEMVGKGHRIEWILQADKSCSKAKKVPLGKGHVFIGPTDDGESRLRRLRKHLLDLANDFRMFRLVRKNRYDLIQVKDKFVSALLAIVLAKIARIRFFYWLAFPYPEASLHIAKQGIARYRYYSYLRGRLLKFLLYNIILPSADHIFVQSEQMKKYIVQQGIAEEKMTAIPGSVNLKCIPYNARPAGVFVPPGPQEKWIVYIGTLNRMRRLDFLIRVVVKVIAHFANAKLYLLGKGDMPEDEAFLEAEVVRFGVEDAVKFTGYLPMKVAWEYIRYADVCVSPIYPSPIFNVGSPTKLIEYMAMGKAVVANNHPEQRLVISESGAGICVPWKEDAFADTIVELLRRPEMAKEMGRKGRDYVERFRTNQVMANIVENQYLRICQSG